MKEQSIDELVKIIIDYPRENISPEEISAIDLEGNTVKFQGTTLHALQLNDNEGLKSYEKFIVTDQGFFILVSGLKNTLYPLREDLMKSGQLDQFFESGHILEGIENADDFRNSLQKWISKLI
jgi:hypothetical protein